MAASIVKRILQTIPTLIGVSLLIFIALRIVPGDPARLNADVDATGEDIAMIREHLGLNKPLYEQYALFMKQLLLGDMGMSMRSHKPVLEDIMLRFPTTLLLTALAIAIMIVVGILTGVASATKPNSLRDHGSMLFALFNLSMPSFWLGLMLILVFSLYIPLFPTGGSQTLRHYILPALTIGLSSSAVLARLTRSSLLDILNQDYIRTAFAKGAGKRVVVYRHALKNALIPIITVVGLEFGHLLGGAVLVEMVFSMNGIGSYLIQSIQFRDYPAVQGTVMFIALLFVLVNLLVDICYSLADPRVAYE
ncbi:ABC transporter permease [Paenibacillaceae bacterium]|nr:ABC transporter permease [Paenibacillaceae bacterium]